MCLFGKCLNVRNLSSENSLFGIREWNEEGYSLIAPYKGTTWFPSCNIASNLSDEIDEMFLLSKENMAEYCSENISEKNNAGFYSYKSSKYNKTLGLWDRTGLIKLWGTVIEYEFGYRSEFAEIILLKKKNLSLIDFKGRVIANKYNIPLLNNKRFDKFVSNIVGD